MLSRTRAVDSQNVVDFPPGALLIPPGALIQSEMRSGSYQENGEDSGEIEIRGAVSTHRGAALTPAVALLGAYLAKKARRGAC